MIDLEQISIRQRENFWFRERTENELRRHSDTCEACKRGEVCLTAGALKAMYRATQRQRR